MVLNLTDTQSTIKKKCKDFVRNEITPYTNRYESEGKIPKELIKKLFSEGYLCSMLPQELGGNSLDWISYGIINEEIGKGSSSVRSLLTVHDMVASAVHKFATDEQKEKYLSKIVSGENICAFCLTEENFGSDAKNIQATIEKNSNEYHLNGIKQWITYGQIADLFLVFAQNESKLTVLLVERNSAGIEVEHITGMLGTNASMLARIKFTDCVVPKENIIGKIGTAFNFIMPATLTLGRYSVACGCVGIIRGCLEASVKYANERVQFGKLLKDHQLIQELITEMATDYEAARLLCLDAGSKLEVNDASSVKLVMMAKYYSSRAAFRAASNAVQIHGAFGCSDKSPVQQYLKDAKVMEIIEGSSQIKQILISKYSMHDYLILEEYDE